MHDRTENCGFHCQLDLYVAGDLSEGDSTKLELHIHQCRVCTEKLSAILKGGATVSMQGLMGLAVSSDGTLPARGAAIGRMIQEQLPDRATDSGSVSFFSDGASLPENSTEEFFPQRKEVLSRYRPVRIAGTGGTSIVWEAWDTVMGRTVAVKLLRAEKSSSAHVARLLHEANALARLSHPNIVSVYELTQYEGRLAIVMEYVAGATLSGVLQGNPLSEGDATTLLSSIVSALAHAHRNGVIHRDLKPSNLLVSWPDDEADAVRRLNAAQIRISDFGLARIGDHQRMTQTGQVVGTPTYMSPEQVAGDSIAIDERTDIYGAGVILYEMLTGRPPFISDDPLVTMRMIQETDPVPPRMLQPKLSVEIELICLKCLSKHPADRYSSALGLLADLQAVLAGQPIMARPLSLWMRGKRWVKRNRKLAIVGVIALASLMILVTESLIFARTQGRLRQRAEQAEKTAASRTAEALAMAKTASENADKLRQQLLQTLSDIESVQQYLEKTGVLAINDAESRERHGIVTSTTMRAYERYLNSDVPGNALSRGDLAIALNFLKMRQALLPLESNDLILNRIQLLIEEATPAIRQDLWFRNAEVAYYQLRAENFVRNKAAENAAREYLKMAEGLGWLASQVPASDPLILDHMRTQSMVLVNAASQYASVQKFPDSVEALEKACAVHKKLIAIEHASDADCFRLLELRLAKSTQLARYDQDAARRESMDAILFSQTHVLRNPASETELARIRAKHESFLAKLSGR